MIDHISVAVSNLTESAAFYDKVLEPIGLKRMAGRENTIGYGKRYLKFWLNARLDMARVLDETGNHVCLRTNRLAATIHHTRRSDKKDHGYGKQDI